MNCLTSSWLQWTIYCILWFWQLYVSKLQTYDHHISPSLTCQGIAWKLATDFRRIFHRKEASPRPSSLHALWGYSCRVVFQMTFGIGIVIYQCISLKGLPVVQCKYMFHIWASGYSNTTYGTEILLRTLDRKKKHRISDLPWSGGKFPYVGLMQTAY